MSGKVNIPILQATEDSARGYKWDVAVQFGDLENDSSLNSINFRCTSIDVPNPNHTPIDVSIRGFTKKESGAVDWNPITLTIIEVQDYAILQRLYDLGMRQFDYETGVQEDKESYSSNNQGILIQMNSLNDSVPMSWQLYGCIMDTYAPPQMSADKASIIEIPVTVSYDYAMII